MKKKKKTIQMCHLVAVRGMPPASMIEESPKRKNFFERTMWAADSRRPVVAGSAAAAASSIASGAGNDGGGSRRRSRGERTRERSNSEGNPSAQLAGSVYVHGMAFVVRRVATD